MTSSHPSRTPATAARRASLVPGASEENRTDPTAASCVSLRTVAVRVAPETAFVSAQRLVTSADSQPIEQLTSRPPNRQLCRMRGDAGRLAVRMPAYVYALPPTAARRGRRLRRFRSPGPSHRSRSISTSWASPQRRLRCDSRVREPGQGPIS